MNLSQRRTWRLALQVLSSIAFTVLAARDASAQGIVPYQTVFQEGERLTYKVKWGFLRLGTVALETHSADPDSSHDHYVVELSARSKLPVLKFQRKSLSVLDPEFPVSENLLQLEFEGADTIETRIQYDRETRRSWLVEKNRTTDEVIRSLARENSSPYLDAISMWFYARLMSQTAKICTVQTLRDFELKPTVLDFRSNASELEIGALDEPVRVIEMVGNTASAGQSAGGFEGDFRAWFSDDQASILLRAEIKIAVGKIKIELESWDRKGWVPPRWGTEKLVENRF